MNKLISIIIVIVIGLAMVPLIVTMSDDYDLMTINETFVATEVLATPETVTVVNTPVEVLGVKVNDVALILTTEYTVSGSNITILANNSDVDDVISVNYSYELEIAAGMDSLIQLLPLLFIIMIVSGVAFAVYKSR